MTEMAHDVFISYSAKDKAIADSVCAALESNGVKCWIAPRDIATGSYSTAIIKAINSCKFVILVLSSSSNQSKQVINEIERAVSKGKVIYPFRIEEVLPSEALELFISSEHWLDAFTPPLSDHLKRLTANVKSTLSIPDDPNQPISLPHVQLDRSKQKVWLLIIGGTIAAVLVAVALSIKWWGPTFTANTNTSNANPGTPTPISSIPVSPQASDSSGSNTSGSTNPEFSNSPIPIRYWIKDLPEVSGYDAAKLWNNALGSWQAVVTTPIRRADSEAAANVIIISAPDAGADVSEIGPPRSKSTRITVRFGSSIRWDPRNFEAASCRMIGHILGLENTSTPGQVMTESAQLETVPLTPQADDIRRVRQIWDK